MAEMREVEILCCSDVADEIASEVGSSVKLEVRLDINHVVQFETWYEFRIYRQITTHG